MNFTQTTRNALTVLVIFACLASLTACHTEPGAEYVGKWQDSKTQFEIKRNGDNFLFILNGQSTPAIYKDGLLRVEGDLSTVVLSYVRNSDTLTSPGYEYHRVK